MAGSGGEPQAAAARVVLAGAAGRDQKRIGGALRRAGIVVVAEPGDATSATRAVREHRPDAVLLDVDLPGGGVRAAEAIAEIAPGTPCVMLTSRSDDDPALFDALRAGAVGYLPKNMDPQRLPYVLSAVLAGEAALPRAVVAKVVTELQSRVRQAREAHAPRPANALTEREAEVLALLERDMTTAEIAAELYVSTVTVRSHVHQIIRKLGVPDRDAAVRLARATA